MPQHQVGPLMLLSTIIPNPQPHILDVRSLWVFRTGLGLYLCYDVLSRVVLWPSGNLSSIEWYTTPGFLLPQDSPHGNVVHQLWFARTSPVIQFVLFGLTFAISLFGLVLGGRIMEWKICRLSLWLLVVSMQHRCMHSHDGSDNYCRQLLMWFCLLPNEVHYQMTRMSFTSFNGSSSYTSSKQQNERSQQQYQVSSLACLGLTLQMTLMYTGTIANRTIDKTQPSWEWLPPKLTAVHYVIRDAFAIRDNWFVRWLRIQPLWMTQGMTAHAMIAESSAIVWFLCSNPDSSTATTSRASAIPWRIGGFWTLFTLHLGLLVVTRLPNWQFMAMIASTLWIPTTVWNSWQLKQSTKGSSAAIANAHPKKTDSIIPDDDSDYNDDQPDNIVTRKISPNDSSPLMSILGKVIRRFLLFYMVYNFAGERRWISKHDGGDIGEFFRISQYWVMYGSPPRSSVVTTIVGYRTTNKLGHNEGEEDELMDYPGTVEEEWIDVMEGLKSNNWTWQQHQQQQEESLQTVVSPRWERALDQWGKHNDKRRVKAFLRTLCRQEFQPMERLELRWNRYKIVPPATTSDENDVAGRWLPSTSKPTVISVTCDKQ